MHVSPVPCLSDNYAYLVRGDAPEQVLLIDPCEAAPIEAALRTAGLSLSAILVTHHHPDHIGGLRALAEARPGLPVLGFEGDAHRIEGLTRTLRDGEEFQLLGLSITALHAPGHTLGALSFYVRDGSAPAALFTGDTLFVGGCGRLFEGTAEIMRRSLVEVLGGLPDDTRVYCGHEYTEDNLRFAAFVEPNNDAVVSAAARARELRGRGAPTVPSTLADERQTNPFLRDHMPAVRAFAGLPPEAPAHQVFAAIRQAKNTFR